jgi:hypothetical protein
VQQLTRSAFIIAILPGTLAVVTPPSTRSKSQTRDRSARWSANRAFAASGSAILVRSPADRFDNANELFR